LLLETVRDLAARSRVQPDARPPTEYEILMAAPLLRKLLLEGQPLVTRVNREYRVKLRFLVSDVPPPWEIPGLGIPASALMFWSEGDGLDPATAPPGPTVELTRDEFLGRRAMRVSDEDVAVKDVVRYAAHVLGAVHAGEPRSTAERALADVGGAIFIGGYDAVLQVLPAISRVVLRALVPLVAAVEQEG
jgi:hypothetical protein